MTEDNMDTDDETYRRAKARVEALKGFYTHLGIYIIINLMLFTINYSRRRVSGGSTGLPSSGG